MAPKQPPEPYLTFQSHLKGGIALWAVFFCSAGGAADVLEAGGRGSGGALGEETSGSPRLPALHCPDHLQPPGARAPFVRPEQV